MSVSVTVPQNFGATIKKTLAKYPKAMDIIMKEITLNVQTEAKSKYARIEDGAPLTPKGTVATRRYPKRTTKEGVRFISGQLNSNIAVRFIKNIHGQIVQGIIGISAPFYAVEHERFGRKLKPGYYAFIWPAFRDTAEARKRKVHQAMLRANREPA